MKHVKNFTIKIGGQEVRPFPFGHTNEVVDPKPADFNTLNRKQRRKLLALIRTEMKKQKKVKP